MQSAKLVGGSCFECGRLYWCDTLAQQEVNPCTQLQNLHPSVGGLLKADSHLDNHRLGLAGGHFLHLPRLTDFGFVHHYPARMLIPPRVGFINYEFCERQTEEAVECHAVEEHEICPPVELVACSATRITTIKRR